MSTKNRGRLVTTKSGLKGRTYNNKPPINKKIAVYIEISPGQYSVNAILCDPATLTYNGVID